MLCEKKIKRQKARENARNVCNGKEFAENNQCPKCIIQRSDQSLVGELGEYCLPDAPGPGVWGENEGDVGE